MTYTLEEYVADICKIDAEETEGAKKAERIRPLAKALAAEPIWDDPKFRNVNAEQGFGVHMLHEQEDHSLAVFIFAWPPGGGTNPHNHKTWAVVAGIEGEETEVNFKRLDDGSSPGYAELKRGREEVLRSGMVGICLPEDIHSVTNKGDVVSVSLHTYGLHLNHTGRSEFDVEAKREKPFKVAIEK